MKQKINITDLDRKLPFEVPEDYFDTFSARMTAQLEEPRKTIGFSKSLKIWISIAAIFVGVVVVGKFYYLPSHSPKELSEVSAENYESYVLSQVDEAQLVDVYVNDDSSPKNQNK
jgi:hypothetical protein